jgi:hypothetical protein
MNDISPVIDFVAIFIAIIALYFAVRSNILSKKNNVLTRQIAILQGTFEKPLIEVNFGNGELFDIYYLAFKSFKQTNILVPFSLEIINNGKAKAYDIEIVIKGDPSFLSIDKYDLFPKQEIKINKYDGFTNSENHNSIVIKQSIIEEKSSVKADDIFLKINSDKINNYSIKNQLEYLELRFNLKVDGNEIVTNKLIQFGVLNIEKIGLKKTMEIMSSNMADKFNQVYNNLNKYQKFRYHFKSDHPLKRTDKIAIISVNELVGLKHKTEDFIAIKNLNLIAGIKQNKLIIPEFWRNESEFEK